MFKEHFLTCVFALGEAHLFYDMLDAINLFRLLFM